MSTQNRSHPSDLGEIKRIKQSTIFSHFVSMSNRLTVLQIRDPVLFDPWIRDGKKSGSRMTIPDHISESLCNNFFGLKFFDEDPGSFLPQDPGWNLQHCGLSCLNTTNFPYKFTVLKRKNRDRKPTFQKTPMRVFFFWKDSFRNRGKMSTIRNNGKL